MYLYFIQCHDSVGLIKVGRSNDPVKRLETLQTGSPHRLTLLCSVDCKSQKGSEAAEALVHKVFAFCRRRGEWFSATEALRHFIASLSSGAPFVSATSDAYKATKKKADKYNQRQASPA